MSHPSLFTNLPYSHQTAAASQNPRLWKTRAHRHTVLTTRPLHRTETSIRTGDLSSLSLIYDYRRPRILPRCDLRPDLGCFRHLSCYTKSRNNRQLPNESIVLAGLSPGGLISAIMPGVEVMGAPVDSPERPSLTSHKALPRRGIAVPNPEVAQPASPDQNGGPSAAPAPPLTPPGANQDAAVEGDCEPRKVASSLSESQTADMLTPRRPSKPPTPGVTPPRTSSSKRQALNQFVHLSSSSRAESFQTACESISSESEMEIPGRPSQKNPPRKIKQRTPPSRRNVSDGARARLAYAEESPYSASLPHSETEYETGLESLDGEWASTQVDNSPTPLACPQKVSETRNQSSQKQGSSYDKLDVHHLDASLMREKSLRDRVQDTHVNPSIERSREHIGWSSQDGLSQAEEPDVRRLSGISSASTVEAMIIDSPKRAQRLLRHTEKRTSLRSASSPVPKSERTSMAPNPDSQHRLVHKAARISEQDRRSISSDVSLTSRASAGAPHASCDIIPVVVVPERRSSLKSGPNSRVSSKPASQRSSQRPPVASNGSAEGRRQRKRTMSDSMPARSRDMDSRGRPSVRPVIPPRSSSLSAPTSRNNSRTTSLTPESLRSHTLAMDLELQKRLAQQPVSPPRRNILDSNSPSLLEPPQPPALMVSSSDDMATLRPPSLPHTQWSIPSSSPGPVEIREAQAVSLFAHHNTSLLLIDQPVPPAAARLSAFQKDPHDRGAHPRTRNLPTRAATVHVGSPWKNPRPPPKPPTTKPLPPTPAQDGIADASQDSNSGLNRRWGSVRRTWGARPRSDTFNSIARSLSMKPAKNRKAGVELDSRLHPFWRPRGFWDVPVSPEKVRPSRQRPETPDDSLVVNNSLGLPQQRIIFDGPSSLAARPSPEMRRRFNASHGSLVNEEILRTGSPLYQQRYWALSRWRLRLRSMSLRNVRSRLRHMRQRRGEKKRAARRETLKPSIGGPVYTTATNWAAR